MKNKLWIIVLCGLLFSGIISISIDIPTVMKTKDGSYEVVTEDMNIPLLSSINDDFLSFLAKAKSFCTFFAENQATAKQEENTTYVTDYDISSPEITSTEIESDSQLITCTIERVVDGDTIVVTFEDGSQNKVRLIGIDTPESVHSDVAKNNEWGILASEHTKNLVTEEQSVWLEYDASPLDTYGRTLAYVWLTEDTTNIGSMLNAIIVADGYAVAKEYPPNTKYSKELIQLMDNAQVNNIGLWEESGFRALWE